VSLSQEPAFSALQNEFVCGVRDISNEPYAGLSGRHETGGNAVNTTNGAGPHNLQLFMLSADGTVLECLPGFWNPQDLLTEMKFANELNQVWLDSHASKSQKDQTFRQMQLAHVQQHPTAMTRRSRMQGFDQKWEAEHRLFNSDTIAHPGMISQNMLMPGGMLPQEAFKTTDQIMHERMSARPFVPINQFDVAAYVEYGKPKYDKNEDARLADGTVNKELAKSLPTIGNKSVMGMMGKKRQNQVQDVSSSGWGNGGSNTTWNSTRSSQGQVSGGNAYNSVHNY
jgi:hypothetical protein